MATNIKVSMSDDTSHGEHASKHEAASVHHAKLKKMHEAVANDKEKKGQKNLAVIHRKMAAHHDALSRHHVNLGKEHQRMAAKVSTSASSKMSVIVDVDEEADDDFMNDMQEEYESNFGIKVKFIDHDQAKFTGMQGQLRKALIEYYHSKPTAKEAHPEIFK